ncbi:MAG TPA: hypothetical protein VFM55_17890 [Micromonosporaceae bacterium]|nr:hypothetical protein [Micromonosporaceae bacterium]
MATWDDLERSEPELAQAGRRLLFQPGVGFGYLATVRADGGPRVHPVMPLLADGRLQVFVVPSPKLADLRRDGRYALHSTGAADVPDEFYITGTAWAVESPARRQAAMRAHPVSVAEDHVLVELDLDGVLWAHYPTPVRWPPAYRRWRAAPATRGARSDG